MRLRVEKPPIGRYLLGGMVIMLLIALAGVGAVTTYDHIRGLLTRGIPRKPGHRKGYTGQWVPTSIPPSHRHSWQTPELKLSETNSQKMVGFDDVEQRWSDVAGNYYAQSFISGFSYTNSGANAPEVRVLVNTRAPTFQGRIEARGLKPNFVYQMKLRGVYDNVKAFENIGYIGRWRLPGRGTNYTDDQYRKYPEKNKVKAYVYFDFFKTDEHGNAARDFSLIRSLHITWNATRQRADTRVRDLIPVIVKANNPAFYAKPKPDPSVELLWLERERIRYATDREIRLLAAGDYTAELVLTEETFHAIGRDGGFWPTVFVCPVAFTVLPQPGGDRNP